MSVTSRPEPNNERPQARRPIPAVELMRAARGVLFASAAFLASVEGMIRLFLP